jgi:antirestriction protein ArdC
LNPTLFELPQAVFDKLPKVETHQHNPIEAAERIISGMPNPLEIRYAGDKAFYSPLTDRIALPPRELFASAEELYATRFTSSGMPPARPSGSTANPSPKQPRSARPCTAAKNSSPR